MHSSSLSFACGTRCDSGVYAIRLEEYGRDSLQLAFDASGQMWRYETALRYPELLAVGCVGDSISTIVLLEPGEHLTAHVTGEVFSVYGSRQMGRLAAFEGYLWRLRDSVGRLAAAYPSTNRGGVYDSMRRSVQALYDSLMEEGRRYALEFIEGEPYSKIALVALLSELEEGVPLFPIARYDTLYGMVLDRMLRVYPTTRLTDLVSACRDSVKGMREQPHLWQTGLRVGDTLSEAFCEDMLRMSDLDRPLRDGYLVRIVRGNALHASDSLSVREKRLAADRVYARMAIDSEGRVWGSCWRVGEEGGVLVHAWQGNGEDSMLGWLGVRGIPISIFADAHGVVRDVVVSDDDLGVPYK